MWQPTKVNIWLAVIQVSSNYLCGSLNFRILATLTSGSRFQKSFKNNEIKWYISSHPNVFLEKAIPKTCSKFTGEHLCQSVISIKLQSNFIEIKLRHECSPVNLLHIFRTPFLKNTSRGLLLMICCFILKALFLYKIFKYLSWLFWLCRKTAW